MIFVGLMSSTPRHNGLATPPFLPLSLLPLGRIISELLLCTVLQLIDRDHSVPFLQPVQRVEIIGCGCAVM